MAVTGLRIGGAGGSADGSAFWMGHAAGDTGCIAFWMGCSGGNMSRNAIHSGHPDA